MQESRRDTEPSPTCRLGDTACLLHGESWDVEFDCCPVPPREALESAISEESDCDAWCSASPMLVGVVQP